MLKGSNVAVFDLEIKATIDGQKVKWSDHALMGISVGVAFFYKTMSFKVYLDDNISQMADDLMACDLVSGFNIEDFDLPLLRATVKRSFDIKIYDLLKESRTAFGVDKFAKGFKLDNHLESTFGKEDMKIAHGAEAPGMFQNGRMGELITYCIADVAKECKLFEHAWDDKPISNPNGERVLFNPKKRLENLARKAREMV